MISPCFPVPGFSVCVLAGLVLLPTISHAALEADVMTSRGVVTIDLGYTEAPLAVANFITLAEGSRSWVDSSSGAVDSGLFYDGLVFHRVENTSSSKLAETGSRDGSGNDDAGFTVLDQFHPSLSHEPYVVAMTSDGPNTGGCRWYLTGDLAMPARDGRGVVFGKVTSPASRVIVDSILSGGIGTTTVTGISIRRTDPAAEAFDEMALALPEVSPVRGSLSVQPAIAVKLDFPQPASTMLRARSSLDLTEWIPHFVGFAGIDDTLPPALQTIDGGDVWRRFYNFSLTAYSGAGGASTFAYRTLTTETSHAGQLIYQFDATGMAGTYSNTPFPGFPPLDTGTFVVRTDFPPRFDAYFFRMLVQTSGLGDTKNHWIRGGFDMIAPGKITGRQISDFHAVDMSPVFAEPEPDMPLELSRP